MDDLIFTPLDIEDPAQVDAAFRLVSEDELSVVGFTEETPESFRARLAHPDSYTPAHRLATRAGAPVGVLLVERDQHGREVFLDAYAPVEDRTEVLGALVASGLASAQVLAHDDPAPGIGDADPYVLSADIWQVASGAFSQDESYAAALAGAGFRTIRRFWRMTCDLSGVSDAEPAPPAGVTRRVVSGDDDRRTMHRLFSESFAEHFGSTHDHPFDEWIASVEALPGVDPTRWWIASLDGVDVGICLLDDSRAERLNSSYVRTIGVVPSGRGRGIARWLLACAAADAVSRGRSAIALSVDGENTTGATALYESAGYVIEETIDVWCYPLVEEDARLSADSR